VCALGGFLVAAREVVPGRIEVDPGGASTAFDHPHGIEVAWIASSFVLFLLLLAALVVWVGVQLAGFRRSTGARRLQLKWLLSGAAIFIAGALVNQALSASRSGALQTVADVASGLEIALPIAMGVAILRFRLYEIDRLISRTLSYLVLTALLGGGFLGIVALANGVLAFGSPVAVSASTLVVAALFSPVRRRVQRAVDRRFNRRRYDADATIEAFAARLRERVAAGSAEVELLRTVDRTVEPVHVGVWILPR
jgi:hypothetical protein